MRQPTIIQSQRHHAYLGKKKWAECEELLEVSLAGGDGFVHVQEVLAASISQGVAL